MIDNLKKGIEAARAGNAAEAIRYLKRAINLNPNDLTAWLWLSYVVDDPRQQKDCMQRVVNLSPSNFSARKQLRNLDTQLDILDDRPTDRQSTPSTLKKLAENHRQQKPFSRYDKENDDPLRNLRKIVEIDHYLQKPKLSPLRSNNYTKRIRWASISTNLLVGGIIVIMLITITTSIVGKFRERNETQADQATVSSEIEGAAATNFELWSSDLHRNEHIEVIHQDGEIAKVRIIAEFRNSPNADWVEKGAEIACKKVNQAWDCDQDFDFQLTSSETQKSTSAGITEGNPNAPAIANESEAISLSKYQAAEAAYGKRDWIKATILYSEIIRIDPNYLDVSDKLNAAKTKVGDLILVHNSDGTISKITWDSEIKYLFRLPGEVLSAQHFEVSNDLSQIIYAANDHEILIIDKNGEHNRLLISFPGENFSFSQLMFRFSPDGSEVLFKHKTLGVIDIKTRQYAPVCADDISEQYSRFDQAEWSNSGNQIFVYQNDEFWITTSDRSECTLIADISDYGGGIDFGTWSPDNQAIIWAADNVLYSTAIASGKTEVLNNRVCSDDGYAWVQDGQYLAAVGFGPGCTAIQFIDIGNPGEILEIEARKYFNTLIWRP